MKTLNAKFPPGKIVMTRGALDKLEENYAVGALARHLMGDWGTVDNDDWNANDTALKDGGRLLSVFPLPNDPADFWIITEADRSVTTLLLPEEY